MANNGWGGQVGIGTTAPTSPLSISAATIANVGQISLSNGASWPLNLNQDASSNFTIFNGGATRFTLASTGSIGIGTTTPLSTLDVRGNSGTISVASISGKTSFAALVTNNDGAGDLFTASQSGWTRFVIKGNGDTTVGGNLQLNGQRFYVNGFDGSNNFWFGTTAAEPGALFMNFISASGANSAAKAVNIAPGGGYKLYVDSSGSIGVGTNTPLATFDIRENTQHLAIASISGSTSFAALVVNQSGVGDIFTASAAGKPLFTITKLGNVIPGTNNGQDLGSSVNGWRNIYGTTYFSGASTGVTASLGCVSSTLGIVTGSGTCPGGSSGGPFSEALGAIFANNSTEDLLIGGQSSASAKFSITGISNLSNQINASLSGQLIVMANNGWGGNATISGALTLGAFSNGVIQTTKNQLLTLGGNTTGGIQFKPGNSSASLYLSSTGNVGIGTTTPTTKLDIAGSASLSGSLSFNTYGSELRFYDNNFNYTGFKAPSDLSGTSNYVYALPTSFGTNGQFMATDGLGGLSWSSGATASVDMGTCQERRTTNYTLTNAFANVTLDATDIENNTAVCNHDGSNTDRIDISESGLYALHYQADVSQGTTVNDYSFQIVQNASTVVNGSALNGKNSSTDKGIASATVYVTLTAGDFVRVQAKFPASTGGIVANLVFSAVRMAGPRGGSGPFSELSGTIVENNTTEDLLIGGTSSSSALFRVTGKSAFAGTTSVASISANTSFAALVIDQKGNGDLIAASASGFPIFTVTKAGNVITTGKIQNGTGTMDNGLISGEVSIYNTSLAAPATNFALSQNAAGNTALNGVDIGFRIGNSTKLTLNSNGFGVGTQSPRATLDVVANTTATSSAFIENQTTTAGSVGLTIKMGATTPDSTTHLVNFLDQSGRIRGSINFASASTVAYTTSGIADFAEFLKKDPNKNINWGEILCENTKGNVEPCARGSSHIVGVASEFPAFVGGENLGDSSITVGLQGVVLTKVSNQNGNIQAGDYIAASSIPGVGAKAVTAGQTVGIALADFSPNSSSSAETATNSASLNIQQGKTLVRGWSILV